MAEGLVVLIVVMVSEFVVVNSNLEDMKETHDKKNGTVLLHHSLIFYGLGLLWPGSHLAIPWLCL